MLSVTRLMAGLALGLLGGAGCAGHGAPSPTLAPDPNLTGAGTPGGITQSVTLLGELTVDPVALSIAWTPAQSRAAAGNTDIYQLPLPDQFHANVFQPLQVFSAGDAIEFEYLIEHPFAASDVSGRADLGFTGYVVFMASTVDVPGSTFFAADDPVVVNTELVANADVYVRPRGLLPMPSLNTNCWPAKLIVDEALDNRVGVSNGGNPLGNGGGYQGWQTGSTATWTGYDVLHQGQSARSLIHLSRASLTGPITIPIGLMLQYIDPVSGTPRAAHRLPSSPPDIVNGFGYRYPLGALDCSVVAYQGQQGADLIAGQNSGTGLQFRIRDWDAEAPVGFGNPEFAARGMPQVEVNIPGLFGTTIDDFGIYALSEPGVQRGLPSSEIGFQRGLVKPVWQGQAPGTYLGLARITDKQAHPATRYLDHNLAPLLGSKPVNEAYQRFTLDVVAPTAPQHAVSWGSFPNDTVNAIQFTPQGTILLSVEFAGDIDFGGGLRTGHYQQDVALLEVNFAGDYIRDWTWPSSGFDHLTGMLVDAAGNIYLGGSYTSGTGIDFGGGPITPDTDGSAAYLVKLGSDGGFLWQLAAVDRNVGFPFLLLTAGDAALLTAGGFDGPVDLGQGPIPGTENRGGFFSLIGSDGQFRWSRALTGSSVGCYGLTLAGDKGYVGGQFYQTLDLGLGPHASAGDFDLYLLAFDLVTGDSRWDWYAGSNKAEYFWDLATGPDGNLYLAGHTNGAIDFGGGVHPTPATDGGFPFLLSLTSDHALRWDQTFPIIAQYLNSCEGIHFDSSSNLYLSFRADGPADLGAGPSLPDGQTGTFMASFSSAGGLAWTTPANPQWSGSVKVPIVSPDDSRLYYTGSFHGTSDFDPGPGESLRTAAGSGDIYLSWVDPQTGLW